MLSDISSICSIVGLVISLITMFYAIFIERKVGDFERNVLFNMRVPEVIRKLGEHNSQLSRDLGFQNAIKIKETLNFCKTNVLELQTKLPQDLKSKSKTLVKQIQTQYKSVLILDENKSQKIKFWQSKTSIEELYDTYNQINSLITGISSRKKDKRVIR